MTIITYDAVADIISAINDDWNKTGTGGTSKAPRVREVWNTKVTGYGSGTQEEIIIEPIKENIELFALHGDAHKHEVPMKIDIRSYSNSERQNVIVKEVSRIIKNIVRRASQGFIDIRILDVDTLTPQYRNMYRDVISIIYRDVEDFTFT